MEYTSRPNQNKSILSAAILGGPFNLSEAFFCISLFSMFLPIKVYPAVYLLSAILFIADSVMNNPSSLKIFSKNGWLLFLAIFTLYATLSFFIHYKGEVHLASSFLKLLINFIFLSASIFWLSNRDNQNLLRALDLTLLFIFLLCLCQLLYYHKAFHFHLIYGSESSGKASTLYNKALYFWGLDDKNMFGARLALMGFAYILIPIVRFNRVAWWRIIFIFLLGYLSLSRTPIVALIIGVFFLVWIVSKKYTRIALIIVSASILPFVAQKLIRVDHLTASNDGMGVRITYWKAFFKHFTDISPLGNGFLQGNKFLEQYASFYHGEPHLHNTFMSCYLEFGIIGFLSYILFIICFYRFCLLKNKSTFFWLAAFLPLLAIMMILYSGYDNDIIIYLTLIYLLGSIKQIDLTQIKMRI